LSKNLITTEFYLEPANKDRLASLIGPYDDNLKHVERRMGVEITYQGNMFKVMGKPANSTAATDVIKNLYIETQPNPKQKSKVKAIELLPDQVHLAIQGSKLLDQSTDEYGQELIIRTRKGNIKPRNPSQLDYVSNVLNHDITFGIGPAGTGKTYLAVACAVDALERQEVRRILLTRPAVEAGEKLGFLPGDITQVDLPRGAKSGLRHTIEVLSDVDDISFNFFKAGDVVRHPVVAKVVMAYEKHDEQMRRLKAEKEAQKKAEQEAKALALKSDSDGE